jgi:hypothetical protein
MGGLSPEQKKTKAKQNKTGVKFFYAIKSQLLSKEALCGPQE